MTADRIVPSLIAAFSLLAAAGCRQEGGDAADAGVDQQERADAHEAERDEHDAGGDEGHEEGHHDEDVVRLSDEQLSRAGVRIEPLGGGRITEHLTLPAEVGLNEDAVLHVTPRVGGIVASVHAYLGHDVAPGDTLAVLDSPQLGEAKIAYLQAVQSATIADAELELQRTISAGTEALLALLRREPTLDALRTESESLRIGANKGRLISAYAKVIAARANDARERGLRDKGLATESDLLAAQEAYNSSRAEYIAAFEETDFTYRLRLTEAERAARVAASAVGNAERRLHLLGLSDDQVRRIADEPDVNVARYELNAPAGGRIVAKHITPGEMAGADEPVYTIANLDTVWLNVAVYAMYADLITQGQHVTVHAGERTTTGVVDYVSAIVSESTRTLTARVVLDNSRRNFRPGEFVTVRVETGSALVERAVPIDAVQTVEGRRVVFVRSADGIRPVPVVLGRRNDDHVELLGDSVAIGAPVVVSNSFLIKAQLGKDAAGHHH